MDTTFHAEQLADQIIAERQSKLKRRGKASIAAGKLLSHEQSMRLQLLASTDRESALASIASHLRVGMSKSRSGQRMSRLYRRGV